MRRYLAPRCGTHSLLDVGDDVVGGVDAQVGLRFAGQGTTAPAPTLVDQHGAVGVRVEEAALTRCAARAGSAVEVERGFASGIAAALPMHLLPIAHVEQAAIVRLNRRESARLPALLRPSPSWGDTTAAAAARPTLSASC